MSHPEENPPLEESEAARDLSLEELGQAYAELMQSGEDPYEPPGDQPPAEDEELDEFTHCDLSPRGILEAILFVGHPENVPVTSRDVASLMRGVRAAEIDELVDELREDYEREKRPYTIVSAGAGYRLQLRDEWDSLSRRFHGRAREARLSQSALDLLAIVAYQQGIDRSAIDRLRERPSGALLNQLVRRKLLRVEREKPKSRKVRYYTTERFLELFQLTSLDDLPQISD